MIIKKNFIIGLLFLFFSIHANGEERNNRQISLAKTSERRNETDFSTNNLLKSYMELSAFRHKTLSQNMANINTPGYKADEVEMPKEYNDLTANNSKVKKIKLSVTSSKHIRGSNGSNIKFHSHKLKDPYEIKPNGNNVSLAQQMTKLSQNQQDYNSAVKGYATMNNLISSVLGK